MRIALFLMLSHLIFHGYSQTNPGDSVKQLQPILIQAYATDRPLNEVPAAVGYISAENLNRFNNTSILPAVNTIPGVRMEERSPGSYRFSIRGSLLRSPFGVRNVKMYWNGLPLTDGGGNTYLNLLDFNSVGSMEIIKGPGGSLYGAGTGGVLLLNSPSIKNDQVDVSALTGSFGLQRYNISAQHHAEKMNIRIQYAHQQYDGYREQTRMSRDAFNADLAFQLSSKSNLSATIFYTDLFYQTPGGLTKIQYDENPSQARPPGGPNKGAVEQQAAVSNKTPYIGLSYDYDWNNRWSTRVGVFGSHSNFVNPTIRNYEIRKERNAGARTETYYRFGKNELKNKLTFGGEFQYFKSPLIDYDNNFGVKGATQTNDDLASKLMLLFAQSEFEIFRDTYFTVGASVNFLTYDFTRYEPGPLTSQTKRFNAVFSPRAALLKKINDNISVYANVSRGFSPPSLAEVRPSTNNFNNSLKAESGTNYEIGFRGNLNNKFSFDVALYDFHLNQTIVIQRTPDNADYFVNAGKTTQRGIEVMASWNPLTMGTGVLTNFKIWTSYSFNHYRFTNYVQDGNDWSGKKLTGMPPTVSTSGLDLAIKKFYLNLTASYVDHVPLNDGNTAFAAEYFLMSGRLGYKNKIGKHILEIFTGVDNALDKKYSLGNDLNAVGGRYFNAAAPRNFYGGIKLSILK